MKVQSIYNSKILKKGLEFAANRKALFVASTSFVLSTVARPIAIMSTPKTDEKNKKYACAKSLASSAIGYLIMLGASLPVSNAIKKINKNPKKYLKTSTIKTLQAGEKTLLKSRQYKFATQLFDLGLGFVIAMPKSIMTCALIPPIMSKLFSKKESNKINQKNKFNQEISFKGGLAKSIGKIMNTDSIQNFVKKFYKTNSEQHIMCLTDALTTGTFIVQTSKSKKIEQDHKKTLMWNAGISTGLCIIGGYLLNKVLEKPTQKFITKFKTANKNSPKLDKYLEGIRVAKPALILGGIYYIAIPMISTFLADRAGNSSEK